MKAPVRIGIVGLGRLGQRHARNLAWHVPGATLAAACSPVAMEREWAAENLPELRLYDDYESILKDALIDAVWLVTPTSLHADQIIAALRAGKHVFCEKPLSLDLEQCDRVIEESARFPHLHVMIGFVRRFDASYRDAFNKISEGAIGRPFMVRSQTVDKNDPDGFFVRFAPTSGGLFLDCSVHDIDLARWMLGNPRVDACICERHDRDPRRAGGMRRYRQRCRYLRIRGRPDRGVPGIAHQRPRSRYANGSDRNGRGAVGGA